jgi:hypothetical protein
MYSSVISADDPDLSAFREAGGKLVSFHGLVSLTPLFPGTLPVLTSPPVRQHHPTRGYRAVLQCRSLRYARHRRLLPTLRGSGSGPLLGRTGRATHHPFSAAPCMGRERHCAGDITPPDYRPGGEDPESCSVPVSPDGKAGRQVWKQFPRCLLVVR